jgi:pectate lyase
VDSHKKLEIYAPLYDDIDFDSIKIKGRYRKIVIDKCHNTAYVCNNVETEKYNLDFPVEDILGNIILRNIQKRKINGFVRVDDNMAITQKWMFDNILFCGEPIAVRLNNKNGLIAFGNNDNNDNKNAKYPDLGGIVLLNMEDGTIIKLLVNDSLTMGFHTVSITR